MQTHHRRSIRLPSHDYTAPAAYFITLYAHQGAQLFGEIIAGRMHLSSFGHILDEEWNNTALIRPEIKLDIYQIMPNHFHGILIFRADEIRADGCPPLLQQPPLRHTPLQRPPRSLGSTIAGIKSITTKRINLARNTPGKLIWLRNYYEHIIRNETDFQRIRDYIQNNPSKWQEDQPG